jgi:hypothetical protein
LRKGAKRRSNPLSPFAALCIASLAMTVPPWWHGFRVDLVDLLESVSSVARIF